jgi:outer membrane protein OmpA-like peptidoglycan-associated protein
MMRSLVAVTLIAAAVLAAGATPAKPEADLARARAAVTRAEADPGVAKLAASELERARTLLAEAEHSMAGRHEAMATHYAYLATQTARIAEQRAREQIAMARVQAGELERAQLLDAASAAQSRATLDSTRVTQTERGMVLTLEDGTFDSNRAVISPAARRGLDVLAKFLQENPGRRVQIEAFTDAEGTSSYNLELSQDRADAVALAVIDRGVDAARVRAVGWGERWPVADNDSEESRKRNRRVEIIVSHEDAAVPVRVVSAP